MIEEGKISYLNTDLDLVCDFSLEPLANEFEQMEIVRSVTRGDDGRWYAMCETMNEDEPEQNILKLLDAIDRLTPMARDIWNSCSKREFNVGYDCGDEPWAFNQGLSNDVLHRMANCGATLRITIYPQVRTHPAEMTK